MGGTVASATVDRKAFLGALAALKRATPKIRCSIPALACLKITTLGAEVEIAGTDMEAFGRFTFKRLAGEGDFVRAIPCDRVTQLVRGNKASTLTIEEADVSSMKVDGTLLEGLPIEDYPVIPGPESVVAAVIPAKELAEGIRAVSFAISGEVVRYALTGIHFDGDPKKGLNFVASDGKRLAWQAVPAEVKERLKTIVPEKTALAIQLLAEAADPKAEVEVLVKLEGSKKKQEVTQVQFRLGGGLVGSRIIEGRFPDYEAVVPDVKGGWVIERKALLKALADIWPVLTAKTMAARFTFAGGKLEVYSKSQDIGEAKSVLSAKGPDSLVITFNPDYVREYLRALPVGCDRIRIMAKDRATATLWKPSGGSNGHSYVLMPLTLTWTSRGAEDAVTAHAAETKAAADETKPAPDETEAPVGGTEPAADETVETPAATPAPTEAPPSDDAESVEVEKDMPKQESAPTPAPEEEITSYYGSAPEEGA